MRLCLVFLVLLQTSCSIFSHKVEQELFYHCVIKPKAINSNWVLDPSVISTSTFFIMLDCKELARK